MSDDIFTEDHLREAEKHNNLGPAYFAAGDAAKRFLAHWTEEHAETIGKAIAKQVTDEITEKVWDAFRDWLLCDAEMNAATTMLRMVDGTVNALLSGKEWALKQYPLAKYHNGEAIRKAVAEHIGDEVARRRIEELEAEVARLSESLEFARRSF